MIFGNTSNLKTEQLKQLKKLSQKKVRGDQVISSEIAIIISKISFELNRQIGLLIDRNGHIQNVLVGDRHSIEIPKLPRERSTRLRGLRLVHTHLKNEALSEEDLYDLTLLKLDYITAITVNRSGQPQLFYSAHVLPIQNSTSVKRTQTSQNTQPANTLQSAHTTQAAQSAHTLQSAHTTQSALNNIEKGYQLEEPFTNNNIPNNFKDTLNYIEDVYSKFEKTTSKIKGKFKAILVGVYTPKKLADRSIESSIKELTELCETANIEVVEVVTQKRNELDPLSLIGSGKVKELANRAVQLDAEIILFDLELSPAQAKRLSELCELKIIDRTQLILDIFANNAKSRDGKLQVELAQLRYLKGRLSEKDDNMSRLTGGIGGRGPGETKLEIGRRRVEDRINRLEKELETFSKRRSLIRSKRQNNIPLVSIVGYTNAGKSTLLNVLTNSEVLVENKLFATLDPTTRRLRFPKERDVVLADTVGFIHDLPPELKRAFTATLEELKDANLLLHCIDASDPNYKQKIKAVENILEELELDNIYCIKVFNKCDLITEEQKEMLSIQVDSICISAIKKINIIELLKLIEKKIYT